MIIKLSLIVHSNHDPLSVTQYHSKNVPYLTNLLSLLTYEIFYCSWSIVSW